MKLRVLSYNIHKGRAFFTRQRTWEKFYKLVHEVQPDLIFLQEFLLEPQSEKLLEEFADHIWPHYSFGQNATTGGHFYGNAILSKWPILETHNHDISNHRLERRGVLYARIEIEKRPLHLFCSHMDLTFWGRKRQIQKVDKIVNRIVPSHESLLFCGDMNDWHNKLNKEIEMLLQVREVFTALGLKLPQTSPSVLPVFPLDRIFFRGVRPFEAQVSQFQYLRMMSDHLPLVVDLDF